MTLKSIIINNSQSVWGKGKMGEGFSETTIKDTWTKTRERVEAREEGGFGWVGGSGGGKMQTTVIE